MRAQLYTMAATYRFLAPVKEEVERNETLVEICGNISTKTIDVEFLDYGYKLF